MCGEACNFLAARTNCLDLLPVDPRRLRHGLEDLRGASPPNGSITDARKGRRPWAPRRNPAEQHGPTAPAITRSST
eukprot:9482896-Pyramimonas_sp.AAC.1